MQLHERGTPTRGPTGAAAPRGHRKKGRFVTGVGSVAPGGKRRRRIKRRLHAAVAVTHKTDERRRRRSSQTATSR